MNVRLEKKRNQGLTKWWRSSAANNGDGDDYKTSRLEEKYQKFSFRHIKFEVPVRQAGGDVDLAAGNANSKERSRLELQIKE